MSDSYEDYYADNTDDKRSISYSVSLSSDRNKRCDFNSHDTNTYNSNNKYSRKYQFDDVGTNNESSFSNKNKGHQQVINLERDREYLIRKNRDLEDSITRLENVIDTQFNITQPKNTFASYPNNKNIANYSSIMTTINSFPPKKTLRSSSKSQRPKSKNSKSRPKNQRTSTPLKITSTLIKSKTKAIWNNEKEKEEKQAMTLRDKANGLKKRIEDLKEELKLNVLESKGESYLLYEVDKWQKRTNIIGKDYIENLALLKKKLFNDKIDYQTEIKQIQNICAFQLSKLKENCDGVVNKQNYTIEGYMKNNNDLRKRLDKLKNVFVK